MFTGIITAIGTIDHVEQHGDLRARIASGFDMCGVAIGASIACSGVCLTVVAKSPAGAPGWFDVDVSHESLARTAPGMWEQGRRLNLERALKVGDELGGHIVTGHVDGVGHVVAVRAEGHSHRIDIAAPQAIAPYLAAKGSVTVDGVSLTVNEIVDQADDTTHFALNIIPHTATATTLGRLVRGDAVNLEIDVLARYLGRMEQLRR